MSVPFYAMPTKLILASNSPRRAELLQSVYIPFEIIPPTITEKEDTEGDPMDIVLHNAQLKANHTSEKFPNELILAADTVVALGKEILHKPKDLSDAFSMLRRLSNKTHQVYTGICLKYPPKNIHITYCEVSEVTFKLLDDSSIRQYLTQVHCLDKAGAYAIQEHPELIIAGYKGHMSNIIGLPIEHVHKLLRKFKLLSP